MSTPLFNLPPNTKIYIFLWKCFGTAFVLAIALAILSIFSQGLWPLAVTIFFFAFCFLIAAIIATIWQADSL
jgi:hypothetical protein